MASNAWTPSKKTNAHKTFRKNERIKWLNKAVESVSDYFLYIVQQKRLVQLEKKLILI